MKSFKEFIIEASDFDEDLEQRAVKKFGTTHSHSEAGYVLRDGRMLDFSGKNDGGPHGMRSYDHREVQDVMDDKDLEDHTKMGAATRNMRTFMHKTGAIRYHPESGGNFDAVHEPTNQQLRTIMRGHRDLSFDGTMYVDHHNYETRENRSKEFHRPKAEDIKSFFRHEDDNIHESEYRMQHTAPKNDEETNAPGHAMDKCFPDFYHQHGWHFYGHGDRKTDQETHRILSMVRGKPDKVLKVYRAVPIHAKEINPGDWVTPNLTYAKQHGEGFMGDQKTKILSKKVRADEIWNNGDSMHEFGYHPKGT